MRFDRETNPTCHTNEHAKFRRQELAPGGADNHVRHREQDRQVLSLTEVTLRERQHQKDGHRHQNKLALRPHSAYRPADRYNRGNGQTKHKALEHTGRSDARHVCQRDGRRSEPNDQRRIRVDDVSVQRGAVEPALDHVEVPGGVMVRVGRP